MRYLPLLSSVSECVPSDIDDLLSMTGEGARDGCAETVNLVGDAMGNDSGAEVNSSTSAAVNFKTSPLPLVTESFRGFLTFSSGISWSS